MNKRIRTTNKAAILLLFVAIAEFLYLKDLIVGEKLISQIGTGDIIVMAPAAIALPIIVLVSMSGLTHTCGRTTSRHAIFGPCT